MVILFKESDMFTNGKQNIFGIFFPVLPIDNAKETPVAMETTAKVMMHLMTNLWSLTLVSTGFLIIWSRQIDRNNRINCVNIAKASMEAQSTKQNMFDFHSALFQTNCQQRPNQQSTVMQGTWHTANHLY